MTLGPSEPGVEGGRSGWWTTGLALPPARDGLAADLVVVGLGGSGLGAVHRALDRGLSVIGLDAQAVGDGAAGRNGGFLLAGLAAFHHEARARLGRREAVARFRITERAREALIAEVPACVRRVGSLRRPLDEREREDVKAQAAAMGEDGLDARWVDEPDGAGLWVPGDAAFDPFRRVRSLAVRAMRRGARLFARTPVTALEDGRVATPFGRVQARSVVLATDAGAAQLGFDLGIRRVRLQMLATAPARDVVVRRAIYARWGYDYWQQRSDGALFLGGGRDLDPASEPMPPGPGAPAVDPKVQAYLERQLREVVGTAAPVRARWAGLVGYTDDGRPRLARLADGVMACGGYSGHGNVIGWALARAAVDLLVDGPTAPAPEAARLAQ